MTTPLRFIARRNDGITERFASKELADAFLSTAGGHVLQTVGRRVRMLYEVVILPCRDTFVPVVKRDKGYSALEHLR
jgi:hypothetical protein